MRAFPLDILGKVVLSFLAISDEERLWEKDSAFRTVYTWCMAAHRESGLRRRKEGVWPLIRSTVAVFSLHRFDWTDKLRSFSRYHHWKRTAPPSEAVSYHRDRIIHGSTVDPWDRGDYGAVCDEWDRMKHGDVVLKHLCVTGPACDASTLIAAAGAGFFSTVRYLVEERGINPAANSNSAIRFAAEKGHTDVVQLLLDLPLERGVDAAAKNNFVFRYAARNGHTDVVQLLLDLPPERGVDPAADGNSAFCSAALNGHTNIVQLLLDLPREQGVDPAAKNNYAFRYAAMKP